MRRGLQGDGAPELERPVEEEHHGALRVRTKVGQTALPGLRSLLPARSPIGRHRVEEGTPFERNLSATARYPLAVW